MSHTDLVQRLIARSTELSAVTHAPVLVDDPDANALVTDLAGRPHAFVYACIADRQVKAELAWSLPHALQQRLGSIDPESLHSDGPEAVARAMRNPTTLHRFPEDIGEAIWRGAERIVERYQSDASRIWSGRPSSAEIVARFLAFSGVGPKIGTMATNILVHDFHVPVPDRYSIDISVDVQVRRVMQRMGLVETGASNDEIVYRARALSPDYPGAFDLACWEIGRTTCRPRSPDYASCLVGDACPRVGL